MHADITQFFTGVYLLLVLAASIGLWLKRGRENSPVINNLMARIIAWWVMVTILMLAFSLGRIGANILFALISFVALREFLTLLPQNRADYRVLVACFYLLLPVQYALVLFGWYGMFSVFIPVYGFLLLPVIACFGGDTSRYLERTAQTQWAVMISVFCISHVPALLNLTVTGFEGENILLVMFLITVVQAGDVLQYVWGKLLGRKKIMPSLSPSKTVAGTVGGILSASAVAGMLSWMTPFTPVQAVLIGLLSCVMGFFGGMVMSSIKRDHGVKDWGNLIHGHGGMLDRVDSICFAAPVFFHIVRFFWT